MIRLRELEIKDAPYMLECMNDENVCEYLRIEAGNATCDTIEKFIRDSWDDANNLHLGIVEEDDEYLGTVSLKNIDNINHNAEFAIVIRSCTMGKGVGKQAMRQIINKGIHELNLHKIYWCVAADNIRAIRFYEKGQYHREALFKEHVLRDGVYKDIIWYSHIEI